MSDSDIRLCKDVPDDYRDLSQCYVVWNGTADMNYLTGPGAVNNGQAAVNYDQAPPLAMSSVISSLAISASSFPSSLVSSPSPSASAVDLGAAAGAAAGLLAYAAQKNGQTLGQLEPYPNETAMVDDLKKRVGTSKGVKALVIGALGRCGRGAVDLFRKAGLAE